MRNFTTIDNVTVLRWGISYQEAILFEWLYSLPSWATKATIDNETYYFASYLKACQDLPNLTEKVDTMYRLYKKLEKENLIVIKTIDSKTYISLTEKAKEWNSVWQKQDSEKNPTELGKLSEDARKKIRHIDSNSIDSNNREKEKKEKKENFEILHESTSQTEIKSFVPDGKDLISDEPKQQKKIKQPDRTVQILKENLSLLPIMPKSKMHTGECHRQFQDILSTEYDYYNIELIYNEFYLNHVREKQLDYTEKFRDPMVMVEYIKPIIEKLKPTPLPEFTGFQGRYKNITPHVNAPLWRLLKHCMQLCYTNQLDNINAFDYRYFGVFSRIWRIQIDGVDVCSIPYEKVDINEEKSLLEYKQSYESIINWEVLDPKVEPLTLTYKIFNSQNYNYVCQKLNKLQEDKNSEEIL